MSARRCRLMRLQIMSYEAYSGSKQPRTSQNLFAEEKESRLGGTEKVADDWSLDLPDHNTTLLQIIVRLYFWNRQTYRSPASSCPFGSPLLAFSKSLKQRQGSRKDFMKRKRRGGIMINARPVGSPTNRAMHHKGPQATSEKKSNKPFHVKKSPIAIILRIISASTTLTTTIAHIISGIPLTFVKNSQHPYLPMNQHLPPLARMHCTSLSFNQNVQ